MYFNQQFNTMSYAYVLVVLEQSNESETWITFLYVFFKWHSNKT